MSAHNLAAGATVQNGARSRPSSKSFDPATQRADALALANKIRVANAATLRRIAGGSRYGGLLQVAAIIEANETPTNSVRVHHIIRTVHRMGPASATKLLLQARIGEQKRISELTGRQRSLLAKTVRDWAART